ncbi:MAG: Ig-like domain-containing protein, partial [bacterium]
MDWFISRLESTGTRTWSRLIGASTSFEQATSSASTPEGALYVAGQFTDFIDGETPRGAQDALLTRWRVADAPPTINLTTSAPALRAGENATITFTLSESSGDFVLGDV